MSDDRVVALTAIQEIISMCAQRSVVERLGAGDSLVTSNVVVSRTADNRIAASLTHERVVARSAGNVIVTMVGGLHMVDVPRHLRVSIAVDDVISVATVERVATRQALDVVVVTTAVNIVG